MGKTIESGSCMKSSMIEAEQEMEVVVGTVDLGLSNRECALQMKSALEEHGFFYIINHGIPEDLIQAADAASRSFFSLPLELKEKCQSPHKMSGYTCSGSVVLDDVQHGGVQKSGDTREFYRVAPSYHEEMFVTHESLPTRDKSKVARLKPTLDKDKSFLGIDTAIASGNLDSSFKDALADYYAACTAVTYRLISLFALSLGTTLSEVQAAYPEIAFNLPQALLSLHRYDATISDANQGLFACGAHTDYGFLTILLADSEVSGLQVCMNKDESEENRKWIAVDPKPGALIVNSGNLMEIMSNKIYRSNLHRVLKQTAQPRYSIAYFFAPNADTKIEPIVRCLGGDDNVAKFEKVVVAKYILEKYGKARITSDEENADEKREETALEAESNKAMNSTNQCQQNNLPLDTSPSFDNLSEKVSDILFEIMMSKNTESYLERTRSDRSSPRSLKSVTSF